MTTTANMMDRVAMAIKAADDAWEFLGLRVQDEPAVPGDELEPSWVWVDGERTEDRLPGTCAVGARCHLSLIDNYVGGYVLLLGADRAETGNDSGELVMIRPVVLHCWPAAEASK